MQPRFCSALSVLTTHKGLLKNIMVSDEHASRGLYTVKFSKSGLWRYVHVDDRIPCTLDGRALYAKSSNANEVWVMLVEKAYAKLRKVIQKTNPHNHTAHMINI